MRFAECYNRLRSPVTLRVKAEADADANELSAKHLHSRHIRWLRAAGDAAYNTCPWRWRLSVERHLDNLETKRVKCHTVILSEQ